MDFFHLYLFLKCLCNILRKKGLLVTICCQIRNTEWLQPDHYCTIELLHFSANISPFSRGLGKNRDQGCQNKINPSTRWLFQAETDQHGHHRPNICLQQGVLAKHWTSFPQNSMLFQAFCSQINTYLSMRGYCAALLFSFVLLYQCNDTHTGYSPGIYITDSVSR